MSYGTSTGRTPRTTTVASPDEKPDVRPRTEFRVRCPDCEFSKRFDTYADAASHQRRHPCPHCDRMLGVSEVRRRRRTDDLDASEAVAAAQEARHELLLDGPAPTTTKILEVMGRDTDGHPLVDGPTDLTAHQAARQLLAGVAE